MITVTIFNRSGRILGFSYEGHAGYAKAGYDIVCAGITAQLMMTYNGLDEILRIPLKMEMKDEGGYFKFMLADFAEDKLDEAQILLKTLKLGIQGIKQQYTTNITLKEEEV